MSKGYTISNEQKKAFKQMAENMAEQSTIKKLKDKEYPQVGDKAKELVNGLTPNLLGCTVDEYPSLRNDICEGMIGDKIEGKNLLALIKALENVPPAMTEGIEEWESIFLDMKDSYEAINEDFNNIKKAEFEKVMKANPQYNTSIITLDKTIKA